MLNNICLIPARAGSKRVKEKNFKKMLGKPIIEYPIETALKSGFDKIIVSSDNQQWLNYVDNKYDLEVTKRDLKNSDDKATIFDVVKETLDKLSITDGKICILYATASLITKYQILQAKDLLDDGYDTVFPVIKTGAHHQKILEVFGSSVKYKYPQFNWTPSQACTEMYVHSGTFFYCDVAKLLKNENVITNNCGCIVLKPWEACEVDEVDDWIMLEKLMRIRYNIV